jgi:penicillin amidase
MAGGAGACSRYRGRLLLLQHFLAREIAAYQRRNAQPGLEDVVAILRSWNGQMAKDGPAPFLITLAYQHVRRAVAQNSSAAAGTAYEFNVAPMVVERLLRERPPAGSTITTTRCCCAGGRVDEGRRIQGRAVPKWRYGGYLRLAILHPVGHRIPVVGKYFDIGPVPMSGTTSTVKQTTRVLAPSMRMNADLGDWDRSQLNLPIGESGQILSSHYKDQWNDYYNGRSYPMQFVKIEAKSTLEFRPSAR